MFFQPKALFNSNSYGLTYVEEVSDTDNGRYYVPAEKVVDYYRAQLEGVADDLFMAFDKKWLDGLVRFNKGAFCIIIYIKQGFPVSLISLTRKARVFNGSSSCSFLVWWMSSKVSLYLPVISRCMLSGIYYPRCSSSARRRAISASFSAISASLFVAAESLSVATVAAAFLYATAASLTASGA